MSQIKHLLWSSGLVVAVLVISAVVAAAESTSVSEDYAPGDRQGIRIVLDEGEIVIELDRRAAPDTIRALLELIESEVRSDQESLGYYDGLFLNHTWPHIEIGTGVREGESVVFPQEIDATSLGFDTEKITDSRTAMNVWQFDFAKANKRWKSEGNRPKKVEEWLEIFKETDSVDFLMEVSIKEINELLGYRYVENRQSLRARRGYVYLEPLSKTENSPALRILLTDRPQLDGRVTVLGRVVSGLDLAQELSVCELSSFRGRPIYEPVDPVEVRRVESLALSNQDTTTHGHDRRSQTIGRTHDETSPDSVDSDQPPLAVVKSEGGSP